MDRGTNDYAVVDGQSAGWGNMWLAPVDNICIFGKAVVLDIGKADMPHATMPSPGFQAVILCGPGASLNTFTSNPKEFPKALLPIANRPMVWYPLDWCYRMGITDITLITPPESAPAIETALAQNPHLTSLPSPKPEVLAPKELSQTTGTAAIFRLPEIRKAITSDFVVLPCDLICELEGSSFIQTWMTLESGLGGASGGKHDGTSINPGVGGERSGRRGGLGVFYPTKGLEGVTHKAEETDFIASTPLARPVVPGPEGSLRPHVEKLVLSYPTSTVKDIVEDERNLPVRNMLLKKYGRVKMKTTYRDAHIYLFPYWVLDMMNQNEFDSVAEDVMGRWAKAGWQDGLGDKLGLREVLGDEAHTPDADESMMQSLQLELEDIVDLAGMSSTCVRQPDGKSGSEFGASRVPESLRSALTPRSPLVIPPLLAFIQPSSISASTPLIRRVDTPALLLSISLRLAKVASSVESTAAGVSPSIFAHSAKVAHPDLMQNQSRVSEADSLVAENVTIESRVNIKESVIGAGCSIGSGSRLTRCLLMDGVTVGENVTLTGCILGRRCRIEGGGAKDEDKTRLTDCEVQGGYVVEWGNENKNEKFMVFEGLSDDGSFDVNGDEEGMDTTGDFEDDGIELS